MSKQHEVSEIVEAALRHIEWHLDIAMWNKHQEEYESPFGNTGNEYLGKQFKVRAFDWNEPEEYLPNFEWKDIKIWWYKYVGRGMYANQAITPEEASKMLDDCLKEFNRGKR